MATYTYDPNQVTVTVGGKIISGFAPDAMVTAARNVDTWGLTVGVDGTGARAKSNNLSGRFTITLLQTSASNDDLQAIYTADELSNKGPLPVYVRDAGGETVASCLTGWIVRPADISYGSSIANKEWVIETDALVIVSGGSSNAV